MSSIYGVDSNTYRHLSPEDQESVRQSYQQTQAGSEPQAPADAGAPQQPDAPPATLPQDAKTPQEVVDAIKAIPLPDMSDLNGMPPDVREQVYKQRVAAFNQARQQAAEEALNRLEPKRSDFDGLDNETANAEYRQAASDFNNSPYVRELRRISAEAAANPTQVPAYLTAQAAANPREMPLPQLRETLAKLGIELPENASPQTIQAAYQLLEAIPQELMADILNPGMQVSYATPVAGAPTGSAISPLKAKFDLTVGGEVELGNVYTGVDFEQTQTLEMSVQMQTEGGGAVGKSPMNYAYALANRLNKLPPEVKQLAEDSPVIKNILKGVPVSGAYTEFTGTRLKYEAVVTPDQGKAIANGDMSAAPNPLDPLNMPTGSSVLIRGQTLEGSAYEAGYKFWGGTAGQQTSLEGMGFGVKRLDGPIVEVYSGPVQTVENSAYLGVGKPNMLSAGVSSEQSLEQQSMDVARIDLSTAEGRAAYQQFLSTGQVPSWNPPGVPASGTTEIVVGENTARVGVQAGPAEVGWGDESQGTVVRTTWADGTVEQSNTFAAGPNHTSQVSFKTGPDGQPIDSSKKYTITLGNQDPTSAAYLQSAMTGDAASFDGKQHVQLTFTPEQLMEIRNQARAMLEQTPAGRELLAGLDAGSAKPGTLPQLLATAKTPDEVFRALSNESSAPEVAQLLASLEKSSGQPIAGQIATRDAG